MIASDFPSIDCMPNGRSRLPSVGFATLRGCRLNNQHQVRWSAGEVSEPHYWHIASPTVALNDQSTGLYIEEEDGNGKVEKAWHESNTAAHKRPFSPGTWTVSLMNTAGEDYALYDDQVKVT